MHVRSGQPEGDRSQLCGIRLAICYNAFLGISDWEMYLPSVRRCVEPLKLNPASNNPKRAGRVLIIILGRKAERYDLGFVLEQRIEPVRKLSFERSVFGLKG